MNVPLLKGNFSSAEALDLLHQLFQVKIKFHESKIETSQNEEDIKMREQRIKALQHDFATAKNTILSGGSSCVMESDIKLN